MLVFRRPRVAAVFSCSRLALVVVAAVVTVARQAADCARLALRRCLSSLATPSRGSGHLLRLAGLLHFLSARSASALSDFLHQLAESLSALVTPLAAMQSFSLGVLGAPLCLFLIVLVNPLVFAVLVNDERQRLVGCLRLAARAAAFKAP